MINYEAPLTARESEIAKMIAMGYTDKEVAHMANITIGTMRKVTPSIYEKMGLNGWGNSRVRLSLAVTRESI